MLVLERMKSVNGRYMKKAKSVMQWGKIFLPLSSIRFFPPQFVLRNPVLEGVTDAFNTGHEVAVIVFNIINQKDLIQQLGQQHHYKFMKNLKRFFQKYIEHEGNDRDVITLHDYYGDGITLIIKVNQDRHSISNIDILMKKITSEVEGSLTKLYPNVQPIFEAGYMFVEKSDCSIQESLFRAHRQALAMAEKRVHSEFNEMVYMIGKIVIEKNITMLAQPIIDVATNKVFALEMLTRGPKGTALESPLRLFSVARQTGHYISLK